MAVINKMKLQVETEEMAGLDTLPPVPDATKVQNYLRSLQVVPLDEGLRKAGRITIHGDDTSGVYRNWPVMIGGHR
jgi:hypothetical protein